MIQTIRTIAVALIQRDDELLVTAGADPDSGRTFYRPPGGGVDFGETAEAALHREFMEELGEPLENVQPFTVLEHIAVVAGALRHEIVFVFKAEFVNPETYLRDSFTMLDGKPHPVLWKKISSFKDNENMLLPKGLYDLL